MNVSSWSIKNPIPAILLFILLTIGGLMSFKGMKIQNFPDIDLPTVTVSASLPGASPAQMEMEIVRKIENSVASLQGVKHIYSKMLDGSASIMVDEVVGARPIGHASSAGGRRSATSAAVSSALFSREAMPIRGTP